MSKKVFIYQYEEYNEQTGVLEETIENMIVKLSVEGNAVRR